MARPQVAFWFVYHVGHGGGSWLCHIVNNHPAGMSMMGELVKPGQLDLKGRGICTDSRDKEVAKWFADRIHYGDIGLGICKSFRQSDVNQARQLMGKEAVRIVQMVRNPVLRFAEKWTRKTGPGRNWFKMLRGRPPEGEREVCEGVSAYFAQNYFEKFMNNTQFPVIRLEDLNRSINKDFVFFKKFMEWLTQTEWPIEYLEHIKEHWTPAYNYQISTEWDDENRCSAVNMKRWDKPTLPRDWTPDQFPLRGWSRLTDWQREAYLKYNTDIQRRLGYNQSEMGSCDPDWEGRGKYPWGEV